MEGAAESFTKKIRDMRAHLLAERERALDALLPSPPGMSLDDISAATPIILSLLEKEVTVALQQEPSADYITIPVAVGPFQMSGVKFTRPSARSFGKSSPWWTRICAWATAHFPNNTAEAERYDELTGECYRQLMLIWNTAHPEFLAQKQPNSCELAITLPPDESESESEGE